MLLNPLLLALLLSMSKTAAPFPPPPVHGYHVVFSDDFRTIDLSPDGDGAHAWYEGVWYSANHAPLQNIEATPCGLTLTWTRGRRRPTPASPRFLCGERKNTPGATATSKCA